MSVTEVIFHELMSWLKYWQLFPRVNRFDMSVMRRVSQFAIGPYVAVAALASDNAENRAFCLGTREGAGPGSDAGAWEKLFASA